MPQRAFFLKVGGEPARGPLAESAIRDAMRTGVVPPDALLGASASGPFEPASVVLALSAKGGGRAGWLFVAFGAIVLVGLLGGAFAFWWRARPPHLCAATPKIFASLKHHVQIDAYVTRGTPKLDAFVHDLESLLRAYKSESHVTVDYRIIEVKDEEQKKEAKDNGLQEQAFGDAEAEGVDVHTGYMGLVFAYGAEKDTIKFLAPDAKDGLEFWITNKLRELHARADGAGYRLGFVTGSGEASLAEASLVPRSMGSPSIKNILTQNFPFYSIDDVDFTRGVDPDLRGMILTQPDRDLSEAELEALDAFVMRGRALAVFASAVNVRAGDATMQGTLSTRGLERLLGAYGITLHRDVVLDPQSFHATVMTSAGVSKLEFPFVPIARASGDDGSLLDARSAVFFRLSEVAFPFASSLELDPKKQPGATARVLARASKGAATSTEDPANLSPLQKWPARPPGGGAVLAASVEGRLTSAFGKGASAGHARVLVIASSQFLANPFARAGNPDPTSAASLGFAVPAGDETMLQLAQPYAQGELTSTILVFKNTLDWLSMDDDLAKCAIGSATEKSDKK